MIDNTPQVEGTKKRREMSKNSIGLVIVLAIIALLLNSALSNAEKANQLDMYIKYLNQMQFFYGELNTENNIMESIDFLVRSYNWKDAKLVEQTNRVLKNLIEFNLTYPLNFEDFNRYYPDGYVNEDNELGTIQFTLSKFVMAGIGIASDADPDPGLFDLDLTTIDTLKSSHAVASQTLEDLRKDYFPDFFFVEEIKLVTIDPSTYILTVKLGGKEFQVAVLSYLDGKLAGIKSYGNPNYSINLETPIPIPDLTPEPTTPLFPTPITPMDSAKAAIEA